MTTATVTASRKTPARRAGFRAFEDARDAIVRLETLKHFLTPSDEETLAILMDDTLMAHLEKSVGEARKKKYVPLKRILA